MDFEKKIFLDYKKHLINKSKFLPNVYPDTPETLKKFPTVLFFESNNVDSINGKSTNLQEFVDSLRFTIEIYTKNQILNGETYSRKEISKELKNITIDFFRQLGFKRTSVNKGEYLDTNVDRNIIIVECQINNWNGKIR